MIDFVEYIESSCKSLGDGKLAYLYKRSVLEGMKLRAKALSGIGLHDEKVIGDLVISEYGNLADGFAGFIKQHRKKQWAHIMKYALPIGAVVALVIIFAAYFTVSSYTQAWDKTWLIIVGGIFAVLILYLGIAIKVLCSMRRIFHPVARVLIVGCVMLFSVFAFLFLLMMLPESTVTWPMIPVGVALALLCDLAFSYVTKQKFRTISFFIYMPAVAAMLYIILAAYGVITWSGGWPVVFAGLAVDIIYIAAVLIYNMKFFVYRQEADE